MNRRHKNLQKAFAICSLMMFLPLVPGAEFIGYISECRQAMMLVKEKKYEEALKAFLTLTEKNITDYQKSDAFEQASLCALKLKRYEEAMEFAKRIPLEDISKLVQMKLLLNMHRWKELVWNFGNHDISRWSDAIAGDAFYIRGRAYSFLKDGR